MISHQSTPKAVVQRARNWARVSTAEPRLRSVRTAVLRAGRLARRRRSCCANAVWYGYWSQDSLRGQMAALVGWGRTGPKDPYLSSSAAYDAAYEYLYHLLPDCRDCLCL